MDVNKKFGKNFTLDGTRGILVQRFNDHSLNIMNKTQSASPDLSESSAPKPTDEQLESNSIFFQINVYF